MGSTGKMPRLRGVGRAFAAGSVLALGALTVAPGAADAQPFAEAADITTPRLQALVQLADGQSVHSTYNGSYLAGARAIDLSQDGDTAQRVNNRTDDPLVVSGSFYDYWQPDRNIILDVYSESMGRTIPLHVMLPADPAVQAPAFYLLNGAGGGEDTANWSVRTDIQDFFADENVNVITPLEGMMTYYTDWLEPVEDLHGENKWETFLTRELPSIVDQALDTNGQNAIAGLSMSGSAVLTLAEWSNPREDAQGKDGPLYQAVGAYSGCAQTGTWPGYEAVRFVAGAVGGNDVTKMWGPVGGPLWERNDATLHADRLEGIPYVYVASGSGLPGAHDTLDSKGIDGDPAVLADQLAVGGGLELVTNVCSWALRGQTSGLGLDNIDYNLKPQGTHSWGYWQDDLHLSWPGIAQAIGATKTGD